MEDGEIFADLGVKLDVKGKSKDCSTQWDNWEISYPSRSCAKLNYSNAATKDSFDVCESYFSPLDLSDSLEKEDKGNSVSNNKVLAKMEYTTAARSECELKGGF